MKKILVVFIFSIAFIMTHAQHSHVAYLTLADSLYSYHNYGEAATYYKRALKNARHSGNIMLKIARAYSKMNNAKEAEPWYLKSKDNNASFSTEDTYHFAKALIALQKNKEAAFVLTELLQSDSTASSARQLLDDLQNAGKYYNDSSAWIITALSLNTPEAEFAPEYYKDGLVYSSAQRQFITNKKYHWDNTHFLNLYYSAKITEHNFKKPEVFDKELNTRFHDGPVSFYAGGERMILNRNQAGDTKGKHAISMSHLSLFDVKRNADGKTWDVALLPFDQPPYSFGHPCISEDGNTLYFTSDIPEGYGGTDIYRVVRTNGEWSTPHNLGPSINTSENEVFPFFINNTLYFASDGHGGLGGLDLFKSSVEPNGFTPPVNLGYPMNSRADDFSLITKGDEQTGYFASARNGNDDLYEFRKVKQIIHLLARVFDGTTKESLPGSSVTLISSIAEDMNLTSAEGGKVPFQLTPGSAYVLIATHNGRTGMLTGEALHEEDHQHKLQLLPIYGDTMSVACVGKIQDEHGMPLVASMVEIIDETTGKKIFAANEKSIVSFAGEKGHRYRIEIQNGNGDITIHTLEIKPDDTGLKTWTMKMKQAEAELTLAARVFNAENDVPLANANVKVISFSADDLELVADEKGYIEFTLPRDAAYVLIGSKDGLTGMNSGIVENTTSKASIVHPVPAAGDSLHRVPVVALVTDTHGEILRHATATITDKATGEIITGEIKDGVLIFFGEQGRSYSISVHQDGYLPAQQDLSIGKGVKSVEKIAVVMQKISERGLTMAVKLFNERDQSPVSGAVAKVTSFSKPDFELVADAQGMIEFSMGADEGYIVYGKKGNLLGIHMGVSSLDTDKSSIIHPLGLSDDPASTVDIFGMVKNTAGEPIQNVDVHVVDMQTGEQIPAKFEHGILSFPGKRDGQYRVKVSAENYAGQEKIIHLDSDKMLESPMSFTLDKKFPVDVNIVSTSGEVLSNVEVTIIDQQTGQKIATEKNNGVLTFAGEQGKAYTITAKNDHHTALEEFSIPPIGESVEPVTLVLSERTIPIKSLITNESGEPVKNADVTVVDVATGEKIPATIELGELSFTGKKGSDYKIEVRAIGYYPQQKQISISPSVSTSPKVDIQLQAVKSDELQISSLITNESGDPVKNAQVTVVDMATGEKIPATIELGELSFTGKKGSDYKIEVRAIGYHPQQKQISIDPSVSTSPKVDIQLQAVKSDELQILSLITNESGEPVKNADVTVVDVATGEKIPATIELGELSFTGKKGSDYKIEVHANGYQSQQKQISIDPSVSASPKVDIQLQAVNADELQISSLITNESGDPVKNAKVTVVDVATGEKIPATIEFGELSFAGKKGSDYKIEVQANGYQPQQKQISIDPSVSTSPKVDIQLQAVNADELRISSLITNESGEPVKNAEVTVVDVATGEKIPATIEFGELSFTGKKGSDYKIEVQANGYQPQQKQISISPSMSASPKVDIQLKTVKADELLITSLITDESGKPLLDADVSVIDLATGQIISSKIENGIVSYSGKRGGAYTVTVKAEGYDQAERSVNIDPKAVNNQALEIKMRRSKAEVFTMAARIFNASDDSPLIGAEVVIMSFQTSDVELHADSAGLVEFNLPEKASYVVIGSKDGYMGMYSGIVEPGSEKKFVTHPVPASNILNKPVPVLALVSDKHANPLSHAKVVVTDLMAGRQIDAAINNGILSFQGERGKDYEIEITSEDHEPQIEKLKIDPNASFVRPLEISMTKEKLFMLPAASELIILNNETPRAYITSKDTHDEIVENNGMLFLANKEGSRPIGKGSLSDLIKNPSQSIAMTENQMETLQNIYFDFNSAELDDIDRQELEKAKLLLQKYPQLQLTVRAHADLRGSSTYNMNLTRKRARTIKSFLVKRGIRSQRVSPKAYGKSAPLIVCETLECTELQHQKNRRAEFELTPLKKASIESFSVVKPPSTTPTSTIRSRVNPNYAKLISKYGDIQYQDLVFKVCVGAYKLNPDLTFNELTDLGQIEKQLVAGINYYYLQDFTTFKTAETARQQVLLRGISDAYIVIFYNGKKISFSEFVSLTKN